MAGAPLLEVCDLSVEFRSAGKTTRAVQNVSWRVERGETLAILGESGSGKSVSAAAVMGLIDMPPGRIAGGRILYRGEDLLGISERRRAAINGRKIAMIFQDPLAHLNPVYPIGWQVAEALRAHGVGRAEARTRALELLDRVGIPDAASRFGAYPHQFSGGQRQRVMIAMAVALKPDLLIADEPTTALDVTVQAQILELLKELQAETGMGLLLITHDLGVVAQMADRSVVMKDGQVVETGSVRDVFHAPRHPYTRELLSAVPGRQPFPAPKDEAQPLIEVQALSKDYVLPSGLLGQRGDRTLRALDGVSLTLRSGETLGIVGESGSGKSTLACVLLRLTKPSSGRVLYRGKDMFALADAELLELRRRVQVVFQDPTASLNPRMTIEEIVSEPWAIHRGVRPKREWRRAVQDLLVQVGLLPEYADRYPHQFSGGQRQRIAIARALALKPEVILCDEAVSALDVSVQAQVIALLKSLQSEYGMAYMFIAHDLPVVKDFADRVVVMNKGKIVEEGSTQDVFTAPRHAYTRALLAASPAPDPDARPPRPPTAAAKAVPM